MKVNRHRATAAAYRPQQQTTPNIPPPGAGHDARPGRGLRNSLGTRLSKRRRVCNPYLANPSSLFGYARSPLAAVVGGRGSQGITEPKSPVWLAPARPGLSEQSGDARLTPACRPAASTNPDHFTPARPPPPHQPIPAGFLPAPPLRRAYSFRSGCCPSRSSISSVSSKSPTLSAVVTISPDSISVACSPILK